ncbi:MAG: phosphotransferase family protein [Thermomicrobiales bacterium]
MSGDWERLPRFLRDSWQLPSLGLAGEPRRVTGGYGRRSWLIEFVASDWSRPRSVQLRCPDPGKTSLALEVARLQWLAARDYPVSPPLGWVADATILDEPFALIEWVPGRTLADRIRTDGWRGDGAAGRIIGLLLARLHALPCHDFPAEFDSSSGPPPLDRIAGLLGSARLDAVKNWFDGHRAASPVSVVCHLDLHPLNVVLSGDDPVVIDWEMARLDHPLMDVAMSQVHTEIALGIGEYPRLADRFAYGRHVLEAYRTRWPVDDAELCYFRALAACRRLGDVAGALQRPGLQADDRAELEGEGASAISLLDREIGWNYRS